MTDSNVSNERRARGRGNERAGARARGRRRLIRAANLLVPLALLSGCGGGGGGGAAAGQRGGPGGGGGAEARPVFAEPVAAVSAGGSHTCALLGGGSVKCWGWNSNGQLGLGDSNNRGDNADEMGALLPAVALGGRATAVAAGGIHTCALLENGSVKCWGENANGRLGLGDEADRGDDAGEMGSALPAVSLGGTATAVAAGTGHTCALLADGSVKCWGRNEYGQLGLGDADDRGDEAGEMGTSLPAVALGGRATAVSAGNAHTCALLADGTVKCWGRNNSGELGLGDADDRGDEAGEMGTSLPAVALGGTATAVAAGAHHACALLEGGSVKCWGDNSSGQLGQDDTDGRGDDANEMGTNLPAIALGAAAAGISLGSQHSCALLSGGTVKCWGGDDQSQLGQGTFETSVGDQDGEMAALAAVALGGTVRTLAAGGAHVCAVLADGRLKCWGDNGQGQLGLGDATRRGEAANQMGANLAGASLLAPRLVAAGGSSACVAFREGDRIKCWGGNGSGQLGLGGTSDRGDDANEMGGRLPFVDLGGGAPLLSVAVGGGHACALLFGGAVKCWGDNSYGQLGLGDVDHRDSAGEMGTNLPAVALGGAATALAAGGSHTCALLAGGAVKCWGFNGSGQLGLGDADNRGDAAGEMGSNLPAVALGGRATAVSAGGAFTCAVLEGGSVKCWGNNAHGQLGLGDADNRGDDAGEMGSALPAVALGTGAAAAKIAAGGAHACALLASGPVKCWGRGSFGQLGQGNADDLGDDADEMGEDLPAVLLGGAVEALATKGDHTCALLAGGSVKCWGYNLVGQLGQGDAANRGDQANEMGTNLAAVALGTGATATAVAAGSSHTCALLAAGAVKCWGANNLGQLGLGDAAARGDGAGEMGDSLPAAAL